MKIVLKIVNKKIFVENEFKIVNNNTDYTIKFVFDKEWSDLDNKTLRIEFEDGNYIDTQFTGDTVALPQISNQKSFRLGVYAGDLHSTSILAVSCEDSILGGEGCEYIIKPTESIAITGTEQVDVTHYAKAQVVDENLVSSNIRKGATILGVEGDFEPEDPSAAEVSYDNTTSGLESTNVQSAIDELAGGSNKKYLHVINIQNSWGINIVSDDATPLNFNTILLWLKSKGFDGGPGHRYPAWGFYYASDNQKGAVTGIYSSGAISVNLGLFTGSESIEITLRNFIGLADNVVEL